MRTILAVSAAAIAIASTPVAAQDTSASPTYGEVTLRAGFTPDPYRQVIESGGGIDASTLSSSCRGFIASAPDYSVNYTAGSMPLYLSATADRDITMVVNGPDGSWYCDDDSGGDLNPLITFQAPQSGRYDIWVGTFGGTTNYPATVNVSELYGPAANLNPSVVTVTPTPPPIRTAPVRRQSGPNVGLPATYRTMSLRGGFTPDPTTVRLDAGGSNSASSTVGSSCNGYIADAPDVRLDFSPGSLPLIFSVDSSADTTLVINDPNGNWHCNDDGGSGLNPAIRFDRPLTGQYDIWIGTYSSGRTRDATLYVSEISSQ